MFRAISRLSSSRQYVTISFYHRHAYHFPGRVYTSSRASIISYIFNYDSTSASGFVETHQPVFGTHIDQARAEWRFQ